jgi:hypothetical protein
MLGGDPAQWRNDAPSLAGPLKNMPNLKTPTGAVFSPGHPSSRRSETYRPSIHTLNFTYEDDHKIKFKYFAGTSRTICLSTETISRPPQSCETISLKVAHARTFKYCTF